MCYNNNKVSDIEGKMAQKDLMKNVNFVKKNREELLKQHENKYLLVFQEKLVGAFDSYEKAAEEGVRLFGMDANFLVCHLVQEEPLNFVVEAQIGRVAFADSHMAEGLTPDSCMAKRGGQDRRKHNRRNQDRGNHQAVRRSHGPKCRGIKYITSGVPNFKNWG